MSYTDQKHYAMSQVDLFLTSTLHTSCVLHWSTLSFNNLESLSTTWLNIYLPVKKILEMKLLKSLWIFVGTFQSPPNGQKMIKRISLNHLYTNMYWLSQISLIKSLVSDTFVLFKLFCRFFAGSYFYWFTHVELQATLTSCVGI